LAQKDELEVINIFDGQFKDLILMFSSSSIALKSNMMPKFYKLVINLCQDRSRIVYSVGGTLRAALNEVPPKMFYILEQLSHFILRSI
jgi:hypothetical protein